MTFYCNSHSINTFRVHINLILFMTLFSMADGDTEGFYGGKMVVFHDKLVGRRRSTMDEGWWRGKAGSTVSILTINSSGAEIFL